MRVLLFILLIFINLNRISSQISKCGHEYAILNLDNNGIPVYDNIEMMDSILLNYSQIQSLNTSINSDVEIPVVFHVIHTGNPVGNGDNISDLAISQSFANLNLAFEGTGISFCMAQRTPNNEETTGINRIDGTNYSVFGTVFQGQDEVAGPYLTQIMSEESWGNHDYVNIWTINEILVSNLPGLINAYSSFGGGFGFDLYDGIVIKPEFLPTSTLSHELGHYLGLYHTFEGDCGTSLCGCNPNQLQCPENNDCNIDGDRICDTAPHKRMCGVCDENQVNNCDSNNPIGNLIYNFMNYSDSACRDEFTFDQGERMNDYLFAIRPNLLISLGCQEPCNEVIAFFDAPEFIDTQESVTFINDEPVLSSWYIDGVWISDQFIFSQNFDNAGIYQVCLVASSDNCSNTHCQNINVGIFDDVGACGEVTLDECELLINGDFEQTISIDEIPIGSYPLTHLGFSDDPFIESGICNWTPYIETPHFCHAITNDESNLNDSNKFICGATGFFDEMTPVYVEAISTINKLQLIDGEEYTVKLSCGVGSNASTANMQIYISLSESANLGSIFSSTEYILNNNTMISGVPFPVYEDLIEPQGICEIQTDHLIEFSFTYNAETMGRYLIIRPGQIQTIDDDDDNNIQWLAIDNVSVSHCNTCSPDFIFSSENCNFYFESIFNSSEGICFWDFGDGQIGEGCIIEHQFPETGVYEVCLSQLCDSGLTVDVCQEVEVIISEPPSLECYETAFFDNDICEWIILGVDDLSVSIGNIQNFCEGEDMVAVANIAGGQIPDGSIVWSTGQIGTSIPILDEPTTTNNFNGNYTVTITDEDGCSSSDSEAFTIFSNPNVSDIVVMNRTCELTGSICIYFEDHNQRTGVKFSLDGGNSYQSTVNDNSVQVCYNQLPGTYDIWARWGNNQCPVFIQTVTVQDLCFPIPQECDANENTIYVGNMDLTEVIQQNNISLPIIGRAFYIEDELRIDQGITFVDCQFFFDDNANMTINENAVFTDECLLTACDYLWEGVIVNGKQLRLYGSVIENARTGIFANTSSQIGLDRGSRVSNCITGISINNSSLSMFKESYIECELRISEYNFVNGIVSIGGDANVRINNSSIHDISQAITMTGDQNNYSVLQIDNQSKIYNNGDYNIDLEPGQNLSQFDYAIRCLYSTAVLENSEVYNTRGGINATSSILDVLKCSKIHVLHTFISSYLGYLNIYQNEDITTSFDGIWANSPQSVKISNNTFSTMGSILSEFGRVITVRNTNLPISDHHQIFNNIINLNSSDGGIYLDNTPNITVEENTINNLTDTDISLTNGIFISAGNNQIIKCNKINDMVGNGSFAGIWNSFGESCNIIENTYNETGVGIQIDYNTYHQKVQKNIFVSGGTGLNTRSNIGPQPFHGNIWKSDGWIREAWSSLPVDENDLMRFTVNPLINDWSCDNNIPSGYIYNPSNVSPNWYFTDDEFCNLQYGDCLVGIAGPPDEFFIQEALEAICNSNFNDNKGDIDCSESWVSSFELFSLLKNLNVKPSNDKHKCVIEFIEKSDTTLLMSFYKIDSILYSGLDSVSLTIVDSLYTDLYDHIDQNGYENVDSLFSDIVSFAISQDSIHHINSLKIDSILQLVIPDTCIVTQAFIDVYKFINSGITIDSLSRDVRNQDILHNVALECPKRFGHIVYIARSYMRFITDYDYNKLDCTKTEIKIREKQSNLQANGVSIYPNPTKGILTIIASKINHGKLEIYDVSSRRIMEFNNFDQQKTINLHGLDPGVYFIKIIDKNDSAHEVKKIIVQ